MDLRLPYSVARNEQVVIKAVVHNYGYEDLHVRKSPSSPHFLFVQPGQIKHFYRICVTADCSVIGFCSGEGGADEDRGHVQRRLQGQTHTGHCGAGLLFYCGALHHRTTGGGQASSGGDGGRQGHDGRRPHPEIATCGGELVLKMMQFSFSPS